MVLALTPWFFSSLFSLVCLVKCWDGGPCLIQSCGLCFPSMLGRNTGVVAPVWFSLVVCASPVCLVKILGWCGPVWFSLVVCASPVCLVKYWGGVAPVWFSLVVYASPVCWVKILGWCGPCLIQSCGLCFPSMLGKIQGWWPLFDSVLWSVLPLYTW